MKVRHTKYQNFDVTVSRRLRDSAITSKNAKLTVNLGAGLSKALPFACSTFADIATEDFQRPADNETRVVVPVGFPGGGVFDFVDRFMEDNPGYVELSDRLSWAIASGLEAQKRGLPR